MTDKQLFGYIYKTTNKINGKIYVGLHKKSFFDESYKGSGKLISQAFKKYGFDNFSVEVLEWVTDSHSIGEREIYWINQLNSTDRNIGYNISLGGEYINLREFSEEHRKHLSESHKGQIPWIKGKHVSEEVKQRLREANLGKPQSVETRQKRSESQKGHTTSEETRKKISDALKGRKVPEKTCQRIREAMKKVTYELECCVCKQTFTSKSPSRKYCDKCKQKVH